MLGFMQTLLGLEGDNSEKISQNSFDSTAAGFQPKPRRSDGHEAQHGM